MVMINQFDLIGDTDVDDPLQIALAQIEIINKKAAAAAAAAEAAALVKAAALAEAAALDKAAAEAAAAAAAEAAAAAAADLELPSEEETEKGVLAVPPGAVFYQSRRGQNGHGRGSGRNFENNRNADGFFAVPNGRGKGSGRNFESNRNVDGYSAVPEDSTHERLGKPSIRGHYDQSYHSRGDGRGRGYLNRDNGEYADQPSRRQYDRRSAFSSPHAKVKGELAPPVKDVPVPQVELEMTPEQNLEENATLEGKSSIPKETVELDNAPSSNALNKDKEGMANGRKEKEPEVKVMTLGEYQKVLEEKRKTLSDSLVAMKKTQERKVDVDKEFESMQQLVVKKENNEFFIKLGNNDKEAGKRKEDTDGDERVKKDTNGDESGVKKDTDRVERVKRSVSMYEFLRLAEGRRGGRRGGRGGQGGRGGRGYSNSFSDESIKDPSNSFADECMKDPRQFPALGGKEVEQQHSSAAQWKKVEQQHSSSAQGRK